MKRPVVLSATLFVFLSLECGAAYALSAVAMGVPDDVAKGGVAIGISYNYDTTANAESEATKQCHSYMDAPASTRDLCKIVAHFDNRCLAVSLDPKPSTPGWGWAVADTKSVAEDQALAMCHQTAGADRAPYCVVSASDCDGTANPPSK